MNLEALTSTPLPPATSDRSGTQSLSRGIKLLRMVATRPQFGWRLSDLAIALQQDKSTVHRMLACMVEERLVEQRASDKHYLPGPLMFELGLALPDQQQFQRRAEVLVEAFARSMAGIGMLLLRSGTEYVCCVRAGALKLAGLMVEQGTRRPLFTSVGGIAILQTLPAQQAQDIQRENVAQEIARRGPARLQALLKMRERSDRHGFGVNLGDVAVGVHSFAVPVRGSRGDAIAGLCLSGTPELFGEERIGEIHQALLDAAAKLEAEARRLNL
jgi:DNA-binding IclR family transcriptional regulator